MTVTKQPRSSARLSPIGPWPPQPTTFRCTGRGPSSIHALLLSLRERVSDQGGGASERAFSFQLFEERSHAELPPSLATSTFGIRRGMKRFGEIAAALLRRCLTDSIGLGRRTKREIRRRDRSIALSLSLSFLFSASLSIVVEGVVTREI